MSNADFCCAENFPVLIPYRDLVKIVEVAKNLERYEKCLSRTNEQLVALRRSTPNYAKKFGKWISCSEFPPLLRSLYPNAHKNIILLRSF